MSHFHPEYQRSAAAAQGGQANEARTQHEVRSGLRRLNLLEKLPRNRCLHIGPECRLPAHPIAACPLLRKRRQGDPIVARRFVRIASLAA